MGPGDLDVSDFSRRFLSDAQRFERSGYGLLTVGERDMVRNVYGHLGQVRRRADVVEYRVEHHAAKLGERLEALRGRIMTRR